MSVTVHHGDCLDVLRTLDAGSVDACCTDPPYHLTSIVKRFGSPTAAPAQSNGPTGAYARASAGFMGKTWDGGDVALRPETWAEVFRVLKPGAHLAAFGGTRTFHRMACAIEDAGFEIRDTLSWLYGTGFPKSHNLSGAWQGWGTALKPAWEPIILARKPLIGTVAANVAVHGTGALNIDGCRVDTPKNWPSRKRMTPGQMAGGCGDLRGYVVDAEHDNKGRWPANVCHDGSAEVEAAFAAFGERPSSGNVTVSESVNGHSVAMGYMRSRTVPGVNTHLDTGSASRFFFSAKADADDRIESKHPTVKPVALMRWLVRLVTPPGGLVLDPFAGTGTTGAACMREGFRAVLIEREAEYYADIQRRLRRMRGEDAPLFAGEVA